MGSTDGPGAATAVGPDDGTTVGSDERGHSETFAVAVLVGFTILMALSAGFYVLAVDTDESDRPTANFSYDYSDDGDSLLVSYVAGPAYPADSVVIESERTEATWARLAGTADNASIEPGQSLVRLSASGEWGEPVTGLTTVRIHLVENDSRRQISNWSAD